MQTFLIQVAMGWALVLAGIHDLRSAKSASPPPANSIQNKVYSGVPEENQEVMRQASGVALILGGLAILVTGIMTTFFPE